MKPSIETQLLQFIKLTSRKFFAFLVLSVTIQLYAYDPPIGIPDPAWGSFHPIDASKPSHHANWPSSEAENFYYIDNSHPSATNSGNTYGYPDRPRLTIPEITYSSGSYIEVHGGPYDGGGQLILTFEGTEAAPCWLIGERGQEPAIQGELIVKGSYAILEGLLFNKDRKGIGLRNHNSSSLNHACVRHCIFRGSGTDVGSTSCITIYGSAESRVTDIVLYDNLIHGFGDYQATSENDYHGIKPVKNADNVWILKNHSYHMGGDPVQVGEASIDDSLRVSNIFVGRNNFYDNYENPVDVKESDMVVFSENALHGSANIVHNNADHCWFLFNKIYNAKSGLVCTGGTNIWFVGNYIYNIKHDPEDQLWNPDNGYSKGAAIHFRASEGGAIDNTIVDCDIGIQLTSGSLSYLTQGNLFSDRAESNGFSIFVANSDVANISVLDHNAMEDMRIKWKGKVYDNPTAFFGDSTQCGECIENSDLGLAYPESSPTLLEDSPAIDMNERKLPYLLYQETFGIDISVDSVGTSRPLELWDIGAFEYVNGVPNRPLDLVVPSTAN